MTRLTLVAALIAALPGVAAAHDTRDGAHRATVQIACFRGPWREIIWDRPEVSFTDDLTAAGYSEAEAQAIGTRICRDPQGVGNSAYLVGVLEEILRTQRPG